MSQEPVPHMALSVVVPCYNEQGVVCELHRRVTEACRSVAGSNYELVLVNDGSTDSTWPILTTLARFDERVVAIDLSRNHGHQLALSAGLSLARGKRVLVMDADLQDPPELLSEMMRLMDDGADVVYGQRVERDGETWFKKLSARVFYRLLLQMTDIAIPRDAGDFRLMSRRVLNTLLAMPEQQRFLRGMISWVGFRQVPLQYHRNRRFAGETKYPLKKMLTFGVDAITGFSTVPLRVSLYVSVAFAVLAIILIFFVLVSWTFLGTVRGWASMLIAMLSFSAVQLFALAVFGEYLGRMFMQIKQRPLFIIREIVSGTTIEQSSLEARERAHAASSARAQL